MSGFRSYIYYICTEFVKCVRVFVRVSVCLSVCLRLCVVEDLRDTRQLVKLGLVVEPDLLMEGWWEFASLGPFLQ